MSENQENFLRELRELLGKYSVGSAYIKDGEVIFRSHDDTLAFSLFEGGNFYNIVTTKGRWSPSDDESEVLASDDR